MPRALRDMSDVIERQADQIVATAVARREVDGVADLARALPMSVVPDLVGWPDYGRKNLLRWGAATFDTMGPMNRYMAKAVPASLQMLRFSKHVVRRRTVSDGSMGHETVIAGVPVPAGPGFWCCTHRRTAMSEIGRTRTHSTSVGMRTARWDSGMAPTPARAGGCLVSRCRRYPHAA